MITYGVRDTQVASIIANGYPETPLIEWDDEDKNAFMSHYMRYMTEGMVAEVITESAFGCHPSTVADCAAIRERLCRNALYLHGAGSTKADRTRTEHYSK